MHSRQVFRDDGAEATGLVRGILCFVTLIPLPPLIIGHFLENLSILVCSIQIPVSRTLVSRDGCDKNAPTHQAAAFFLREVFLPIIRPPLIKRLAATFTC